MSGHTCYTLYTSRARRPRAIKRGYSVCQGHTTKLGNFFLITKILIGVNDSVKIRRLVTISILWVNCYTFDIACCRKLLFESNNLFNARIKEFRDSVVKSKTELLCFGARKDRVVLMKLNCSDALMQSIQSSFFILENL